MNEINYAYFAGFFDGEGCIRICKRKGRRYARYQLDIGITSTNLWILQRLKFMFGGSVLIQKASTLTRRTAWAWRINGKLALQFLRLIYPYLYLKKAEAEIAIEFQEGKTNLGKSLTDGQRAVEEAQRLLLVDLKHK